MREDEGFYPDYSDAPPVKSFWLKLTGAASLLASYVLVAVTSYRAGR